MEFTPFSFLLWTYGVYPFSYGVYSFQITCTLVQLDPSPKLDNSSPTEGSKPGGAVPVHHGLAEAHLREFVCERAR